MVRVDARVRLVVLTIAAALVGAIAAMHALSMPVVHEMASPAMSGEMVGHAAMSTSTATSQMSACASTHCAAARGGEAVVAHALPSAIFDTSTPTTSRVPAPATSATSSRAPPRSGSCSPLCVWRQ